MINLENKVCLTRTVKEVRIAIRNCYGSDFARALSEEDIYEISRFLLTIFNQVIANKNYK